MYPLSNDARSFRLYGAAPEMYKLIKVAFTVSRVWNIDPSLYEAAKYLLDRIDGTEDEK